MIEKKDILEIIFQSVEEINQYSNSKIELGLDSKLLGGDDSSLDSLNLINLIIATESRINDTYLVSISIADEKAMSQKNSPFKSVNSFADYILQLLNAKE